MAERRSVSAYIDDERAEMIDTIKKELGWEYSDSKLLIKLIEFGFKNIEKLKSVSGTNGDTDDIYKVIALVSQGKVFPDVDSIHAFLKGGSS